jgi:hypothetical protein
VVPVTEAIERPALFGRARHLVGVECGPAVPEGGEVVCVFVNAGTVHRTGPHRIYVRLARALAGSGVPSLRFDLSGVGDSRVPAEDSTVRLEAVRADIDEAMAWACERAGARRVVMVGLCSGADHGFDAALRNPRVAGAVLLDPDVHITRGHRRRHLTAAARRGATWRAVLTGRHPSIRSAAGRLLGVEVDAPEATPPAGLVSTALPPRDERARQIGELLQRGTELLYVFTGGLLERYNGRDQFWEAYPEVEGDPRVRLGWLPDADHTFSTKPSQEQLVSIVLDWMERFSGGAPASPAGGGAA